MLEAQNNDYVFKINRVYNSLIWICACPNQKKMVGSGFAGLHFVTVPLEKSGT
jgi:hypothetical protein